MTLEEKKDLLFKDLSGRLPYGVKVLYLRDFNYTWYSLKMIDIDIDEVFLTTHKSYKSYATLYTQIEAIRPYLFPLSSMTEEQKEEHKDLLENKYHFDANGNVFTLQDFYCKYHFDYRGLIPMGLANDATGKNIY